MFTLLTIGDGLVAQIPALLICISAGFIVTRVGGDEGNLGSSIIKELFSSQKVLFIAGTLVLLLGLLPGFPLPVFFVLAAGLFALAAWRLRADGAESQRSGSGSGVGQAIGHSGKPDAPGGQGQLTHNGKQVNETVPLLLLVPPAHHAKWHAAGLERPGPGAPKAAGCLATPRQERSGRRRSLAEHTWAFGRNLPGATGSLARHRPRRPRPRQRVAKGCRPLGEASPRTSGPSAKRV